MGDVCRVRCYAMISMSVQRGTLGPDSAHVSQLSN